MVTEKKGKRKHWFEGIGKCAYCGKRQKITIDRETLEPAKAAVIQTKLSLEKDDQTEL